MLNVTMLINTLSAFSINNFEVNQMNMDTAYRAQFWHHHRRAAQATSRRKLGLARLQAFKARVAKSNRRQSRNKLVKKSLQAKLTHRAWVAAKTLRRMERLEIAKLAALATPAPKATTRTVVKPFTKAMKAAVPRPVRKCRVPAALHRPGVNYYKPEVNQTFVQRKPAENLFTVLEAKAKRLAEQAAKALAGGIYNPGPSKRKLAYAERYKNKAPRKSYRGMEKKQSTNYKNPPNLGTVVGKVMAAPIFSNWDRTSMVYGNDLDPDNWVGEVTTLAPRRRKVAAEPMAEPAPAPAPTPTGWLDTAPANLVGNLMESTVFNDTQKTWLLSKGPGYILAALALVEYPVHFALGVKSLKGADGQIDAAALKQAMSAILAAPVNAWLPEAFDCWSVYGMTAEPLFYLGRLDWAEAESYWFKTPSTGIKQTLDLLANNQVHTIQDLNAWVLAGSSAELSTAAPAIPNPPASDPLTEEPLEAVLPTTQLDQNIEDNQMSTTQPAVAQPPAATNDSTTWDLQPGTVGAEIPAPPTWDAPYVADLVTRYEANRSNGVGGGAGVTLPLKSLVGATLVADMRSKAEETKHTCKTHAYVANCPLSIPMTNLVLSVRKTQPMVLPTGIQQDTDGLVPKYFWHRMPGGEQLNRLVSYSAAQGGVLAERTGDSGAINYGHREISLERYLGKRDDEGNFSYYFKDKFKNTIARVITYQKRSELEAAGVVPSYTGLPARTAREVTEGVLHAWRLRNVEGLRVYVPQDVHAALKLFCTWGRTKKGDQWVPYDAPKCVYVAIPNNWLQPLSGLSYTDVRDAFRYLQVQQGLELPGTTLPGCHKYAPINYVDVEDGFQLYLAGGSMFHVVEGRDGAPSVPYFKPANTASWLRFKPALVGTMNGDNEYLEQEVTKMSALDVFWYAWEAFGFMAMNRDYKRVAREDQLKLVQSNATMGSVEFKRFIQSHLPVDMEEVMQGSGVTHRDLFNSEKYSVVELAMPLPLEITYSLVPGGGVGAYAYLPGETSANKWACGGKAKIAAYIKHAKSAANMMSPGRSKAINMVQVANRIHDLAIMPIGNCDTYVGHKIVTTRFNHLSLEVAKPLIIDAFKANWIAWGFYTNPAFGPLEGLKAKTVEALVAKAIYTNNHFIRLLAANGLDLGHAHEDGFWKVVKDWAAVTHSNKGPKAIKRATINFACVCELKDEQAAGWAGADVVAKQKSKAQLVRTALLFNLPTHDPGMGLVRKDAMKAWYNAKQELAVIPMTQQARVYFVLDERFADQVSPIITGAGVHVGWQWHKDVKVTKDEVIGTVMVNEVEYESIRVRETGHMKSVTWVYSLEGIYSHYFTVYGTVKAQVCNSIKLRNGLKLNALGACLDFFLGYGPVKAGLKGGRLNGEDFAANIDMLVPQDCDKGKDNFAFLLRVVGANYAYHGAAVPAMRELLVETNYAVQRAMGNLTPVEVADDLLMVDAGCRVAGHYDAILADFNQRFTRNVWVWQQTPEPAMAEIIQSQTMHKALHAAEQAAQGVKVKDGWRWVGAAEAAQIKGEGGIGLPQRLLDAIAAAEAAGTYTAVEGGVDRPYVVTNAEGALTDEDTIVCHWVEPYQGVEHHQLLMRGMGWARKDGLDFVYPAEVEYTTIPQNVTKTSIMAFAMLDNVLRGNKALATHQADHTAVNVELDRLLNTFVDGTKPIAVDGALVPIMNLGNNIGTFYAPEGVEVNAPGLVVGLTPADKITSAAQLFTPEAMATLREVSKDRYLFAQWLAYYTGDVLWVLPAGTDGAKCSAHLATLFKWGGDSLKHSGQSAVSALIDFFKLWVGGLSTPHNADCLSATSSYVRMLNTYLEGDGHIRGLLRGQDTVCMKAAASCLVPNDEVWVCSQNAKHFSKVFGVQVEAITHVGFRRMPMFRTNVSKIRFLSPEDVRKINAQYGIWFSPGRVYMGAGQMYSNFGDLDGDAIELDNLSAAVAQGQIPVDDFNSIKRVLVEVLGVDTFAPSYWAAGVANQYVADHFEFGSYKKYRQKTAITFKGGEDAGNLTTVDQFAEFQKAAVTVQTTTVGKTYSAATLNAMLAEVVPVVADTLAALSEHDWLGAYAWALDAQTARKTVYKLLQMYEIALGGYDKSMEAVTLGYLVRAMNGDKDVRHWANLDAVVAKINPTVVSGFSSVLPNAWGLLQFNHMPEVDVRKALVDLGFTEEDFCTFRDCFLMAGLSIKLPGLPCDLADDVPLSLQLILSVIQSVLDITQNKLRGESGESTALEHFHALNERIENPQAWPDSDTHQWMVHLRDQILGETVTGQIFSNYYDSCLNKQADVVVSYGLHQVDAPMQADAQ